MTDFKNFMHDFSNLMTGVSSLTSNLQSESVQSMRTTFQTMMKEAGFVHEDEFTVLSERFEEAVIKIKSLETRLEELQKSTVSEDTHEC